MPFNPNLPAPNSPIQSAELRAQFNGLNDKIPTSAEIGDVTTLNPNEPATATFILDGTTFRLDLGLPQGFPGGPGPQGETGPAFATVVIDSVITLNPGEAAYVTATLIGNELHLVIGLPRGAAGNDGATGPQGIQGSPGEVTAAQLSAAIAGTSANTNAIALLNLLVSDPPTQAEVQLVASKVDELILNGRR